SFTGATALKKDAAAYTQTSLAAQAAATNSKGDTMPKPNKHEKVAAAHRDTGQGNLALMTQAISASLGQAVQNAMSPLLTEIKASNERFIEGLEEIKGLHLINAAASNGDDEGDDEIVLHAGKEDDASASDEELEAAEDASASASDDMEAARGKGGADDDASASDSSSSAS